MFKLVHPPWWLRAAYPTLTWHLPAAERTVYLTFDDGPTPEITEWVLDQLQQYRAQATFFLIGKNVEAHPELFQKLKEAGHALGNHTYNHLNGWQTPKKMYLENFRKCDGLFPTKLFRPPYGKISRSQARAIRKAHKIIMWDVLTYDFEPATSPEECFSSVQKHVRAGSIIVFHDSVKAWPNLKEALPKTLGFLKKEGYRMEAIPQEAMASSI